MMLDTLGCIPLQLEPCPAEAAASNVVMRLQYEVLILG